MDQNQNPTPPVLQDPNTPTPVIPDSDRGSNPSNSLKPTRKLPLKIIIALVIFLILAGGATASFTVLKPQLTSLTPKITPTATPDSLAGWKTYTNNDIGFTISYPDNIFVSSDNACKRDFHNSFELYKKKDYYECRYEGRGNPVYFSVINSNIGQSYLDITCYSVKKVEVTIDGHKGEKTTYQFQESDTCKPYYDNGARSPLYPSYAVISIPFNDQTYRISYVIGNPYYRKDLQVDKKENPIDPKIFERMVSTIKFKDRKESQKIYEPLYKFFPESMLSTNVYKKFNPPPSFDELDPKSIIESKIEEQNESSIKFKCIELPVYKYNSSLGTRTQNPFMLPVLAMIHELGYLTSSLQYCVTEMSHEYISGSFSGVDQLPRYHGYNIIRLSGNGSIDLLVNDNQEQQLMGGCTGILAITEDYSFYKSCTEGSISKFSKLIKYSPPSKIILEECAGSSETVTINECKDVRIVTTPSF